MRQKQDCGSPQADSPTALQRTERHRMGTDKPNILITSRVSHIPVMNSNVVPTRYTIPARNVRTCASKLHR